jgi:hypothetical protein
MRHTADRSALRRLIAVHFKCELNDLAMRHTADKSARRHLIAVHFKCEQNDLAMRNTADRSTLRRLITVHLIAFYDMQERERCYSFLLSRTPHENMVYKFYN